jgi:dTDP-4-dehydrorhamnose reductase
MNKLLITGISSFLGSNIAFTGREKYNVIGTYHAHPVRMEGCDSRRLDIIDQDQCTRLIGNERPQVVVHCSALSDLKQPEKDISHARLVHVEGTKNIVRACNAVDAKIIYVSTDWVFDGKKPLGEKYHEDDSPAPVNNYAQTKYEGELAVKEARAGWIIARPANIYGVNFATPVVGSSLNEYLTQRGGLAHNIIQTLKAKQVVRQPSHVYQCPTLASHFAECVLRLHEIGAKGIYHVCGKTCISRYDFFLNLAKMFGLDTGLVKPASAEDFAMSFGIDIKQMPIEIPRNCCLDVEKIETVLDKNQLYIEDGLQLMLKQHETIKG